MDTTGASRKGEGRESVGGPAAARRSVTLSFGFAVVCYLLLIYESLRSPSMSRFVGRGNIGLKSYADSHIALVSNSHYALRNVVDQLNGMN